MAQQIEEILGKLLQPDTEKIKEGTAELKVVVNNPGIVPVLCTVLGSSQNAQIRQYAAILLKNRLKSKKHWNSLEDSVTQTIRQNILQVLLQEPDKSVCKAICQLISVIAKHDFPAGKWPELFQFLETYITSQDAKQREIGMYVLHTLSSRCGEQLQPYFGSLLHLCNATIEDQENPKVPYYTIQTLTEMVPMLGSDELKPFQSQIPKILAVISNLVTHNEEEATEALEIFDELVESEVSVIVPHIKPIVEFCLQVAANRELSDPLRVKALSFVSIIAREKRKSIIKLKLTVPILNVLFPILCQMPSEDEQDEDFDENESHSPSSVAGQVIDVMALNLPPEKFIQPLSRLIETGLASEDPNQRRAAYTAMAVASEGSADHIMRKLLKQWLAIVYKGLQDPEPMVRNAALFALGQFSEHLQPDISKFSAELLPILFQYLGTATENIEKDPRGVTKTYYALEMFVENLGKDILPHLQQLMEYLLTSISGSPSYRAKELAISALAATANAAEKEITPYFQHIVELFKSFLQPTENEQELKVQVQALDTLGVLARTLKEVFEPLALECVNVGLALLENATDPDLRRCIYGLFAALSTILKENMTPYLEVLVKNMITSVKSTEGVTAHFDHEESQLFNIFEEENIEEEEEAANADIEGFSVENAYMCEKEDACTSLGEIAMNTGVGFMTYMEECYKEVSDLHDYPSAEVRVAAVTGVSNFCSAVAAVAKSSKSPEAQTALYSMLSTTVPKFLMMVKQDKDRDVVIETLEELKNMVEKIGVPVLQGENMLDNWMNIVREVINRKTCCQDQPDDNEDEDDDEAELDSMLIENAGELLPAVAKIVGGSVFSPYFAGFMPELLKKTKKMNSVADRSFAIGTMADTIDALGSSSSQFVAHLYPVFTNGMKDADEEVRSNSVYALGVLAANGGLAVSSFYPQILKNLFEILNKETYARCKDNICATVCRLIMTRIQDVPMQQVFPVVMQNLPLKEDFEENKTVFECLTKLYRDGNAEMLNNVPQLVGVVSQIIDNDKLNEETKQLIVNFVQEVYQKQPDVVNTVCTSIPQENAAKLQKVLTQPV